MARRISRRCDDDNSTGIWCPECGQNVTEGACQHLVTCVAEDSDCSQFGTLYFTGENMGDEFDRLHEEILQLATRWIAAAEPERKKMAKAVRELAPEICAILRPVVKEVASMDLSPEDCDPDELRETLELEKPLLKLFNRLFRQHPGRIETNRYFIDHPLVGGWPGTNYWAKDGVACAAEIGDQAEKYIEAISKIRTG